MEPLITGNPIPRATALQICAQIQEESRGKLLSLARIQCWGCIKFSKGDPEKMCLTSKPGYRGCNLVNSRYDQRT
jgi:hypothetical protein